MDPSSSDQPVATADQPAAGNGALAGGRLRSVATILIFDIALPLAAYNLLRAADLSAVTALLLSGIFPALTVTAGAIRHRRLDTVGALVLAGIVVGTILGLVSHSARLLLVEGSVPTGIFGLACLISLGTRQPLMYSFAREFAGPDTPRGREMTTLWRHAGFRRVFRTITAVWGVAFLIEAALRVVIVYNTSTGTALVISKITPFVFAALLSAWTVAYGTHRRRIGERQAAAAAEQLPPPESTQPAD
jgi:intracellular septation protein A